MPRPPAPSIALHPVDSERIKAIGHYDDTLAIEFPDGSIYHYAGFSRDKYRAFENAKSKGSYFYGFIRDHHDYRKVFPVATYDYIPAQDRFVLTVTRECADGKVLSDGPRAPAVDTEALARAILTDCIGAKRATELTARYFAARVVDPLILKGGEWALEEDDIRDAVTAIEADTESERSKPKEATA